MNASGARPYVCSPSGVLALAGVMSVACTVTGTAHSSVEPVPGPSPVGFQNPDMACDQRFQAAGS
jgi:hypothetical protein